MTLKLMSLIAMATVSNWAMAELINSDSLCQIQREELSKIRDQIPSHYNCHRPINSAARCCAGDNREECSTTAVSIVASTGSNAAADLTIRANTAMVQLIDQNIDRCNKQIQKVKCDVSEIDAMRIFSKAQAKLTDCLMVMRNGYEKDITQANLTYAASADQRQPAGENYKDMIKPAIANDSDVANRNIQNVDYESDKKQPVNLQILGQPDMVVMPFDRAQAVKRFLNEGGTKSYIMGR